MQKIYTLFLLLLPAGISFAQKSISSTPISFNTGALIKINAADSFQLRLIPSVAGRKHRFLGIGLKSLGVAAVAYQSQRIISPQAKSPGNAAPALLLPMGIGAFVLADNLSQLKSKQLQYAKYQLFDRNMQLIATGASLVNKKILRKTEGFILSGRAEQDGYLQFCSFNNQNNNISNLKGELSIIRPDDEISDWSGKPKLIKDLSIAKLYDSTVSIEMPAHASVPLSAAKPLIGIQAQQAISGIETAGQTKAIKKNHSFTLAAIKTVKTVARNGNNKVAEAFRNTPVNKHVFAPRYTSKQNNRNPKFPAIVLYRRSKKASEEDSETEQSQDMEEEPMEIVEDDDGDPTDDSEEEEELGECDGMMCFNPDDDGGDGTDGSDDTATDAENEADDTSDDSSFGDPSEDSDDAECDGDDGNGEDDDDQDCYEDPSNPECQEDECADDDDCDDPCGPDGSNCTDPCDDNSEEGEDTALTPGLLASIFPNAPSDLINQIAIAIDDNSYLFDLDSNKRMAQFLAQVGGEIGTNFGEMTEHTNYSAQRLLEEFPNEFNATTAAEYAHKPEALNIAYANKNGNTQPGDGLKYLGRGLTQLTGRGEYQAFTDWWNQTFPNNQQNFVANPDLVASDPTVAALEGMWDFSIHHNLNGLADSGNITAITRAITGSGGVALKDNVTARSSVLQKAQSVICPD